MSQSEQYVEIDNARLWSCVAGSGRDMLMFNGGPGCNDYLAPVADMLETRCRVVRFESRGCGRSTRDGNYDLATTLRDAKAVVSHYELDDVIFCGHSQGPNHALAYALAWPQHVHGVIGIAGGKVVDDRSWSETFHRLHEEQGEDLGGLVFDADPEVNRIGNATWREYCRRPGLLRELAGLTIPAVFINSEQDNRPNWPTMQLSELLPRSRYVEVAGAAHMIWLSHADELGRELHAALDWIDRQHESSCDYSPVL
jgi:proline iminopeptidase